VAENAVAEALIVVVPAYNAARQLAAVIRRLAEVPLPMLARVIIVNDGSTDETARVMNDLVRTPWPLELHQRARNGGYGAAMKDGLNAALRHAPKWIAGVHADGQYGPEELPRLLHCLESRALDVLQGSRIASGTARSGGMPYSKIWGNAALNLLENWVLGLNFSDYHSGYLLYRADSLRRIPISALSDSFDFDLEMLARARAHGLALGEEPIATHYGDEISHLRPLPYVLRVLNVLFRYKKGHYAPDPLYALARDRSGADAVLRQH
jgi:glycosyltransferase involved in cell wall biosynthesis